LCFYAPRSCPKTATATPTCSATSSRTAAGPSHNKEGLIGIVIADVMQDDIDAGAEDTAQIAPDIGQREQERTIAPQLRRQMGELGLIAPELPSALGGRDERALTSGMIAEQIARGDLTVAYVQIIGSLVGQVLVRNARPELA